MMMVSKDLSHNDVTGNWMLLVIGICREYYNTKLGQNLWPEYPMPGTSLIWYTERHP